MKIFNININKYHTYKYTKRKDEMMGKDDHAQAAAALRAAEFLLLL